MNDQLSMEIWLTWMGIKVSQDCHCFQKNKNSPQKRTLWLWWLHRELLPWFNNFTLTWVISSFILYNLSNGSTHKDCHHEYEYKFLFYFVLIIPDWEVFMSHQHEYWHFGVSASLRNSLLSVQPLLLCHRRWGESCDRSRAQNMDISHTPSMKLHGKNFDAHSSDICQKKRIDMRIPGICGR